jgi:hypothetical protein
MLALLNTLKAMSTINIFPTMLNKTMASKKKYVNSWNEIELSILIRKQITVFQ